MINDRRAKVIFLSTKANNSIKTLRWQGRCRKMNSMEIIQEQELTQTMRKITEIVSRQYLKQQPERALSSMVTSMNGFTASDRATNNKNSSYLEALRIRMLRLVTVNS